MKAGHQVVRYLPLTLLLVPLLALLPDQGHEVIEMVVTGDQWAYIATVLMPLALTATLHSVQMLRRSARLQEPSNPPILVEVGWSVLLPLLITVAGLAPFIAPLYSFELADSECIKLGHSNECRPGLVQLILTAYCLMVISIPFVMHASGKAPGKHNDGIQRWLWRHAPSIAHLALVLLIGIAIWRDASFNKDYGPIAIGAVSALFVVRLPCVSPSAANSVKKGHWQKLCTCVGDAWPTIVLAAFALVAFAIRPVATGRELGSLFVLYAGILSWLVLASFAWTCFLLCRNKLALAGLCLLVVVCLTAIGLWCGSYDAVIASRTHHVSPQHSPSEATATTSIEQDFIAWSSLVGESSTPRRVVIILAEGGGIRAAQWTNQMLFLLNAGDSDILRNTYAVVAVSGGALGATSYLANLATLYDYQLTHAGGSKVSWEPTAIALNSMGSPLKQDLMAPWLARFISLGPIQSFLPGDLSPSATLKYLWKATFACEHNQPPPYLAPEFREACNRLPLLVDAPMSDFPKHVGKHALPRLVYTSTHVETGERVIASSIGFVASDFPGASNVSQILGGEISLLDATYSSARFPGISRPGTLIDANGLAHGHVVDGGYLDGSGALTASDIVDTIKRVGHEPITPIIIDLDSNPENDKPSRDVPNITPSAGTAINQMFGMFEGIKHANGVRDLAAIAALRRQACALGGGLITLRPPHEAAPLALGWTLSQQASIRLVDAGLKATKPVIHPGPLPAGPSSLENAFNLARSKCT